MRHKNLAVIASLSILLAACSSQPPAPEQQAAPVTSGTPSAATPAPVTEGAIDSTTIAALTNPKSAVYARDVYFDYDQFSIKDQFKPLIEAHAKLLTKNPAVKVMIQGNADERGSREYNLALGQKRAEAVKQSLLLLGATDNQVEAVSLGKEKPVCTEHSEDCWAKNRRAHLLYPQVDK
jgi:peptidoglycan-associated lipoprotein